MFRNTVVSLSQFLSQNCIIWITSPTTTVVVEILPRIITWLHYAAIFLAIFWPLTDPLIILFCKPVYILENKLSVLYEYDHIAWSLTNQNPWFGTFFLQWIIFLYCINQTLRVDKNYFHDYFLHFCWVIIIRQWCSSNHNSSAHDFVSKLPNILIRRSHCWPLRDVYYASTEQQGTLLIMYLELNMT